MPYIKKIKTPAGTVYEVYDASAHARIDTIQSSITGAMHFVGITSTAIADDVTTNPITISGASKTVVAGDVAIYGSKEFVWSGSKWQEFGSTGSLKALAFKNEASGEYTPAGNVSASFSGTEVNTTISITTDSNGNYQPGGTVAVNKYTLSKSTSSVTPVQSKTVVTSVGVAAPSATAATGAITYYEVADETLTLKQITVGTGDSVTTGTALTLLNNSTSLTASTESKNLSGTKVKITGKTTADGNITASFSGTPATITVS